MSIGDINRNKKSFVQINQKKSWKIPMKIYPKAMEEGSNKRTRLYRKRFLSIRVA